MFSSFSDAQAYRYAICDTFEHCKSHQYAYASMMVSQVSITALNERCGLDFGQDDRASSGRVIKVATV
jgi:hypothetical protein